MSADNCFQTLRVCLVQCAKSRCGHVLTEAEYNWIPDLELGPNVKTASCPHCGGDVFHTLNAQGQKRIQSDDSPREIDPLSIEPSPKMGPKVKLRILAARARALGCLP